MKPAPQEPIMMRLIENYMTGGTTGKIFYELTINSQEIEDPKARIVMLTDHEYSERLRVWVPRFATFDDGHGERTYLVTALVRAWSRREKRGENRKRGWKAINSELSRSHGDHTTHRDMVLQTELRTRNAETQTS